MDLETHFNDAQARSKNLPSQPPQVLLELYGLFKQATLGDAQGKRPGMLDMRGRAKFDAWAGRAGMSKDDAMEKYIETVNDLEG